MVRFFVLKSLALFTRNIIFGGILPTFALWADTRDIIKNVSGGYLMWLPSLPDWFYYLLIALGLFLGAFIPYHRQRMGLLPLLEIEFDENDYSCVANKTRFMRRLPPMLLAEQEYKEFRIKIRNRSKSRPISRTMVTLEGIAEYSAAFNHAPLRFLVDDSEDGAESRNGIHLPADSPRYVRVIEISDFSQDGVEQYIVNLASKETHMIHGDGLYRFVLVATGDDVLSKRITLEAGRDPETDKPIFRILSVD